MISLNIDLRFNACPKGADTDLLKDTVCYLELVQLISEYCQNKRFNLIENVTKSLHKEITYFISPHKHLIKSVTVELHKISPPITNVHGGVKWTYHINCDEGVL
jgi:dihydroneopterin aldolase